MTGVGSSVMDSKRMERQTININPSTMKVESNFKGKDRKEGERRILKKESVDFEKKEKKH
jgi:hypothetical protein